ncbi:MAG TPA: hypothetical protein VK914_09210 [bacterium]|nr:hypothetical protein [bacterium]
MAAAFLSAALAMGAACSAADFDMAPEDGGGAVSRSATPSADLSPVPGTQVPPDQAGQDQSDQDEDKGSLGPAEVPVWLSAGDVPTAYTLPKYGLRTDVRFYDGGGVYGQAYLGLFSRFFVGGAANVPDFVGAGHIQMTRDDAQVLARLQVLAEDGGVPALSLGWDGPGYDRSANKGLYVSASKQVAADPCVVQFSGGLNAGPQLEAFAADRDLRASGAMTLSFRNVGAFTSLDEMLAPHGPRWCAGIQASFDPVTLGLEFQDLASVRPDTPVSRLLRVAWNGSF